MSSLTQTPSIVTSSWLTGLAGRLSKSMSNQPTYWTGLSESLAFITRFRKK